MRKTTLFIAIISALVMAWRVLSAENDLPMSDNIKILKVTPYGEETKKAFEVTPKDSSYESFFKTVLDRIKDGYKPDCECDLDNDYFISLENREVYKNSRPYIRNMAAPEMMCDFVFSKNRKHAGLIFYLARVEVYAHHFVMVNSKGEVLWEMKPRDFKTYGKCARGTGFPNDEGDYGARHWFVSNDGKLLMMTAAGWFDDDGGMRSYRLGIKMKKGWTLFGSDGRVIAEQPYWSREAAFSNDGSYFVIQEMRDSNSRKYDAESGTSCYDEKGKLLWRQKDIIPIKGPGYFVSPSNNYIIACLKKKKIYDVCVLNRKGKVVAKAGLPYDERSSSNDYFPAWAPDEKRLFWEGGVMNFDFSDSKLLEPVKVLNQIAEELKNVYGICFLDYTIPYSDVVYIGVGHCCMDPRCKSPADETKKIILLLDEKFSLIGSKIIQTPGSGSDQARIEFDRKSKTIYFRTNDVLIQAKIQGK